MIRFTMMALGGIQPTKIPRHCRTYARQATCSDSWRYNAASAISLRFQRTDKGISCGMLMMTSGHQQPKVGGAEAPPTRVTGKGCIRVTVSEVAAPILSGAAFCLVVRFVCGYCDFNAICLRFHRRLNRTARMSSGLLARFITGTLWVRLPASLVDTTANVI